MRCEDCDCQAHLTCLGLGPHSYPGGYFQCAECVLFSAKLPTAPEKARELAHEVVRRKALRVAESSAGTYATALHRFVHFGISQLELQPWEILPSRKAAVSQPVIELFLAWAGRKYKPGTIELTLSALKDWHKSRGVPTDSIAAPEVQRMLADIKREWGGEGFPKHKSGMTKKLLFSLLGLLGEEMRGTACPQQLALLWRDAAWLVLGFYGFFRRSELVALRMSDVVLAQEGQHRFIRVLIRRSKNDQRGKGIWVHIVAQNGALNLWEKVQRWQDYRLGQGAQPDDPFFTKWLYRERRLSPDQPLASGAALGERLKRHLWALKERRPDLSINPNSYSMHSLRRGGVTAAWEQGVPMEMLMAHGRWRSHAIRVYLQATLAGKLAVTAAI